jgi:hypothetical protein
LKLRCWARGWCEAPELTLLQVAGATPARLASLIAAGAVPALLAQRVPASVALAAE